MFFTHTKERIKALELKAIELERHLRNALEELNTQKWEKYPIFRIEEAHLNRKRVYYIMQKEALPEFDEMTLQQLDYYQPSYSRFTHYPEKADAEMFMGQLVASKEKQ